MGEEGGSQRRGTRRDKGGMAGRRVGGGDLAARGVDGAENGDKGGMGWAGGAAGRRVEGGGDPAVGREKVGLVESAPRT